VALLETRDLTVKYGGLTAVDHVSLSVERGQLVGLIGPNGAGKTTFIDGLTGFVDTTGKIAFDGKDISPLPAHRRALAGMVRTWQSLELFDDLSVADNLRVAAERPRLVGFIADFFAPKRSQDSQVISDVLDFLDLGPLADRLPTELSQGQRKLVGVARALATQPKLILMDEPAAGLDTSESRDLGARLRQIVDAGGTLLLVDHDMGLVLNVCDYIYVIEFGQLIAQGTPSDIRSDERVIAAYLGEAEQPAIEEAKQILSTALRDSEPVDEDRTIERSGTQ